MLFYLRRFRIERNWFTHWKSDFFLKLTKKDNQKDQQWKILIETYKKKVWHKLFFNSKLITEKGKTVSSLSFLIKNPSCLVLSLCQVVNRRREMCATCYFSVLLCVLFLIFWSLFIILLHYAHSLTSCVQLSIHTHLSTDVYSIIICCCCCNHKQRRLMYIWNLCDEFHLAHGVFNYRSRTKFLHFCVLFYGVETKKVWNRDIKMLVCCNGLYESLYWVKFMHYFVVKMHRSSERCQ